MEVIYGKDLSNSSDILFYLISCYLIGVYFTPFESYLLIRF